MGFYLDGILQRKVKANRNSKHNWVFNVNLIHTFTSIYVPITKMAFEFCQQTLCKKKQVFTSASLWGLGILGVEMLSWVGVFTL